MARTLLNSLQVRLALRLAALFVAITGIAVGILLYDRELSLRATDLARSVQSAKTGSRDWSANASVQPRSQKRHRYVCDPWARRSDDRGLARGVRGQLLSVARLDAIALDVAERVDLNDVGLSLVGSLAPLALAQKKTIGFSDHNLAILVEGNRYAIENAIRNLVENAITYSPEGSEVMVSTYADGRIGVADQGPGIPSEQRGHIFKRFWRGKGSRSGGAGLGLAIVNEIMKAHLGTVSVEDRPDGGTVFTLRFPLVD
jgi:signal transduction histidine kinase